MAKKTEAQKEKARQYSRDWYARQQREKREAAADAKSADPIKAAAKRLSKWADEELSIRLSPKHENKAAKAATALTVAGNMGPLREVLDQLRETTETMKGAGLQFGELGLVGLELDRREFLRIGPEAELQKSGVP